MIFDRTSHCSTFWPVWSKMSGMVMNAVQMQCVVAQIRAVEHGLSKS